MGKLRLRFSKTGSASFISHLDLMAVMRRALLRAGIGLKYSEGFNPHPYMSVALPLSVGCESVCELMDFESAGEILADELPQRLNRFLPEGIVVSRAYVPEQKFNKIAWLEVSGTLFYDKYRPGIAEELEKRFAAESIIVPQRTKSGVSDVDIAPMIKRLEIFEKKDILIRTVISAQNPTLSTKTLLDAAECPGLAPDFAEFRRIEVYNEEMDEFK